MIAANQRFTPDYAVAPGEVLEEHLAARGLSQAKFAKLCGRSAKLINEIVSGKAPVEPETALEFERVLDLEARIWLGIESEYRLHLARRAEAEETAAAAEWKNEFPVREMKKRGCLKESASGAEDVADMLSFFGVGSVGAWKTKYAESAVAYRHSPSFESNRAALAAWLRLGERYAERLECADYDRRKFVTATERIRRLTRNPVNEALKEAQRVCGEAGVALAPIKPFSKTAVSGAAWWLSPRKAVIQLSLRHKTDDHLWFSFFHEAAHVLLHSKKNTFIDGMMDQTGEIEEQANQWAGDRLVARREWKRFVETQPADENAIRAFAEGQGIAPGIVVGRLQHERRLPWSHLNHLKVKLEG